MTTSSKPFAKSKRALMKALRARGITAVRIEYDGYGDSGQIEAISAANARKQPVDLTCATKLTWPNDEPSVRYGSLEEALDAFAWMILAEHHCGFVNNDGGFGTITIDVLNATITLDHNDRFTDTVNTLTEL